MRESALQNFMQHILLEPGKVYEKNRSLNCQIISNSVIQIHSFCLAGTMLALLWSFSVLMGGQADGQDFSEKKTTLFLFSSVQLRAFECMIQSTNI